MNKMAERKSMAYSIFNMRCPRCREGRMYPQDTLYSRAFMKMHKHCSCCGQSFEPEPGFYLGAMYTSYAIHAVILILFFIAFYQIWGSPNLFSLALLFIIAVIILLPLTFRLSRSLWIHIFVRYEGPCNEIRKL